MEALVCPFPAIGGPTGRALDGPPPLALVDDPPPGGRPARATRLLDAAALDRAAAVADEVARALRAADQDAAEAALDELVRRVSAAPEPDGVIVLTTREAQVLERIGRAQSNREIAEQLYLSLNTVKTHAHSLFLKLDVHSRTEAALWLRTHGMPRIERRRAMG